MYPWWQWRWVPHYSEDSRRHSTWFIHDFNSCIWAFARIILLNGKRRKWLQEIQGDGPTMSFREIAIHKIKMLLDWLLMETAVIIFETKGNNIEEQSLLWINYHKIQSWLNNLINDLVELESAEKFYPDDQPSYFLSFYELPSNWLEQEGKMRLFWCSIFG